MLGNITSIIDNTVIIELKIDLKKVDNLINRYVIIQGNDNNIVGEIVDIRNNEAYINIVGSIIDGKFVFGIINKPSFNSTVKLIQDSKMNSIIGIEEKNKMNTNDDGTFEMYLIPGKYTILIDKEGYLDQYYINVNIADKNAIDLSSYETSNVITLIPGDINKDGTIGILDKTIMTKQNGKTKANLEFNPSADLNNDDVINITDKTILTKNNNLVRKIINLEGEN